MVLISCSILLNSTGGKPEIFRLQDYMAYMAGKNENSTTLAK